MRIASEKLLGPPPELDYAGLQGVSEVVRHQKLLREYVENPVHIRSGSCVYGHFRPVKYLGSFCTSTNDILLFTIIREPISRLISHYRYLLALNESSNPMRAALKDHR